MIQELSEKMLKELKDGLKVVNDQDYLPHIAFREALFLISKAMNALQEYLKDHPFADAAAEINYYKYIFPLFQSLQIFHQEKYALIAAMPTGSLKALKKFYQDELNFQDRFSERYQFHHEYYKLGAVELDSIFFRFSSDQSSVLIPVFFASDSGITTAMSYLFAKFRAYEMIRAEILVKLQVLGGETVHAAVEQKPVLPDVKWTGNQVNMVELIYGLYYTGMLNNGNAEIRDIVEMMEKVFSFKLTDATHTFIEIRRRKNVSPSKFLEQMAAAIQQRVEEDLEYKPNRGPKLKNNFSGMETAGL